MVPFWIAEEAEVQKTTDNRATKLYCLLQKLINVGKLSSETPNSMSQPALLHFPHHCQIFWGKSLQSCWVIFNISTFQLPFFFWSVLPHLESHNALQSSFPLKIHPCILPCTLSLYGSSPITLMTFRLEWIIPSMRHPFKQLFLRFNGLSTMNSGPGSDPLTTARIRKDEVRILGVEREQWGNSAEERGK